MVKPASHTPRQLAMGCFPTWDSPTRARAATQCTDVRHESATILREPPPRPRGSFRRWAGTSLCPHWPVLPGHHADPGGSLTQDYAPSRPRGASPSFWQKGPAPPQGSDAANFSVSKPGTKLNQTPTAGRRRNRIVPESVQIDTRHLGSKQRRVVLLRVVAQCLEPRFAAQRRRAPRHRVGFDEGIPSQRCVEEGFNLGKPRKKGGEEDCVMRLNAIGIARVLEANARTEANPTHAESALAAHARKIHSGDLTRRP